MWLIFSGSWGTMMPRCWFPDAQSFPRSDGPDADAEMRETDGHCWIADALLRVIPRRNLNLFSVYRAKQVKKQSSWMASPVLL